MEIVTSWMKEGLQRGLQQGQQQGRQTGMEVLLLRQFQRHFGTLPAEIEAQVRQRNEVLLNDLRNWLSQAND